MRVTVAAATPKFLCIIHYQPREVGAGVGVIDDVIDNLWGNGCGVITVFVPDARGEEELSDALVRFGGQLAALPVLDGPQELGQPLEFL